MRDLDYMLAVMQAAKEGKEIEVTICGRAPSWASAPSPQWNWDRHDYRIKPEPRKPREWKAVIVRNDDPERLYPYSKGDESRHCFEVVTVREVLPE